MKKILILAVLLCVTVFAFANDFTVQSVNGNVVRESGSQRLMIKAGDTLARNTVVHTGDGASLVLRDARGRDITVPASQNGTLQDLVRALSTTNLTGTVTRTDTSAVAATQGGAVGGTARASDAAAGNDIADE